MRKSLLLSLAALTFAATPSAFANNTLFGGFVPGADMLFYMDAATFSQAPIIEKIQAMNPDHDAAEQKEMAAKFEAATGLTEEDMTDVAFTMDLENIDFNNQDPSQFEKMPAVMAVGLKKAISRDQLMAGIRLIADQQGNADEMNLAKESRGGTDLVVITPATQQDGPKEILAGLSPDGKTVLVAFNQNSLSQAVSRIGQKTLSPPGQEMAGALRALKGKPFRLAFVFPDALKQQIAAGAQGNPMMASMASMQAVLIGASANETLNLNLKLDMANAQAATQATQMARGMLPMMAMQLGALSPQAAGAAQKLNVATEGNYVSVSLTLTEQDLEGGGADRAPAGGGMMMPPQ